MNLDIINVHINKYYIYTSLIMLFLELFHNNNYTHSIYLSLKNLFIYRKFKKK